MHYDYTRWALKEIYMLFYIMIWVIIGVVHWYALTYIYFHGPENAKYWFDEILKKKDRNLADTSNMFDPYLVSFILCCILAILGPISFLCCVSVIIKIRKLK